MSDDDPDTSDPEQGRRLPLALGDGDAGVVPAATDGVVVTDAAECPDDDRIVVLHVDDDPSFLDVATTFLDRSRERFDVRSTTSPDAALEEVGDVDCVVSDYEMPGTDGLELLETIREHRPGLPFLLFTGKGNEEIASEAISAGVTDYLQKDVGTDQYEVLANRIENAVEGRRARTAVEENRRRIVRLVSNLPGIAYRCSVDHPWPMEFMGGEVEAILGRPPEAFVDGNLRYGDLVHEADEQALGETIRDAIDREQGYEFTYRVRSREDGVHYVHEQGQPVFDDEEPVALEGFIRDVTDRLRREELLRRERELVRRSMAAVDHLCYALDDDGRLIRWNDRLEELTGLDADDLEGADPARFSTAVDPAERTAFRAAIADGETATLRVDVETADSGTRRYRIQGAPLMVHGDVVGRCGVGQPVDSHD